MKNKITEPDWVIHAVCPTVDDTNPIIDHIVFETIGLKKHGLMELELNLPLAGHQAKDILNLIAYKMVLGEIEPKHNYIDTTLFTCPIAFMEIRPIHYASKNDLVLRVIVPDAQGKFPWDIGCDDRFKMQI